MAPALCFNLSKRLVLSRRPGEAGENPATADVISYHNWRAGELRGQFFGHFDEADVKGRDVLDFGCGSGALSRVAAEAGASSVTGMDLNPELIEQARRIGAARDLKVEPRFLVASDSKRIDLPCDTVDLILCFDVLEHVIDIEEIVVEWRRVLRPGGRIFIWWVPWLNPYGHHIESLVPLPWAHVFFSERVLIDTCARIYDLPEFRPRWWDLDERGRKKPNKWRRLDRLPGLNRLTISRFQKLCRDAGLEIEKREIVGFGGSAAARLTSVFTRIPGLREFFCSRAIYTLRKD